MSDFAQKVIEAQHSLEQARLALIEEMKQYPTPVSGCDAQYNYLIGERQKVSKALAALASEIFVATPRQPSVGVPIEQR